jgi:hypothetical protein
MHTPNHVGGTELSTHALARGLQQDGQEVQVMCADRWGEVPHHWNGEIRDVYEGIPVPRLLIDRAFGPYP